MAGTYPFNFFVDLINSFDDWLSVIKDSKIWNRSQFAVLFWRKICTQSCTCSASMDLMMSASFASGLSQDRIEIVPRTIKNSSPPTFFLSGCSRVRRGAVYRTDPCGKSLHSACLASARTWCSSICWNPGELISAVRSRTSIGMVLTTWWKSSSSSQKRGKYARKSVRSLNQFGKIFSSKKPRPKNDCDVWVSRSGSTCSSLNTDKVGRRASIW